MLERRPRQIVQAVDGVELRRSPGRDLLAGRRIGLRQVDGRAPGRRPLPADRAARSCSTATTWRRGRSQPATAALRRRMQMIFQDPYASLNPRWRVFDIVAEPIRAHRPRRATRPICASGSASCCARCGLTPADGAKYPHEFSGGQRQRISIARALASAAGVPGVRRADLGARRVGAGADPEPDEGPAARAAGSPICSSRTTSRSSSHLDRVGVMYLGRIVELAPTDDAVPAAPASLHADAARHDPRPRR